MLQKQTKTKTITIRRSVKLKSEQIHKPAKSYDRKKEKIKLKKLLKAIP